MRDESKPLATETNGSEIVCVVLMAFVVVLIASCAAATPINGVEETQATDCDAVHD